jgi:F-type H+-transporting ATPase subunit gamma
MPSLIDFRRRIRSVKNTQQITKAMKMVAAARLRKSEGRSVASRPYTDTLKDVMGQLSAAGTESDHPFLRHIAPDVRRVMLVLFTGDKGLCGSFNANLIKRAEQFLREQHELGNEVELVCVGKKGWQYFSRRLPQAPVLRPSFTDKTSFADLRPLIEELTNAYNSHRVSEVYLIYARFINVVKNLPTVIRLLPIEAPETQPQAGGPKADYELEPSPEELLQALVPRYFQTVLFQAAIENFTSENGARMVAMENATKAAGDMIQDLTLQYNKARQSGITLELLDIVGGAEALKG